MIFEEQVPLAPLTTFRIGGPARYFCRVASEDALVEALRLAQVRGLPLFVLGGGSNIYLTEHFAAHGIPAPTLRQVRNAVVEVRRGKLPDCRLWGTAGSFFKNPVVPRQTFDKLKQEHPGLPGHPEPDGRIKLPLGWILDKVCKVRGFALGKVSTYEKQALVVVAQLGASAADVVKLTTELRRRVQEATGLAIEAEVEWVG